MPNHSTTEQILKLLPQTQCGQCDFPGCEPYAKAIAENRAEINLCPPGGVKTLKALAKFLEKDPEPLIPPLEARLTKPVIAKIRESECIGCMKCLYACPVDAIFGANKLMHVVITDACTGCQLCVEPCPMDCIELIPVETLHYDKKIARERYEAKVQRGDFKRAGRVSDHIPSAVCPLQDKKQFIADAIARAKAKRRG